ncbi:MAG: hypothetical protein QOK71_11100, partial [Nitrososphaeraceae archaeon]|nr:hypothetical protein [Nitrososphaeraceae archaeon]
YRRKCWSLRLLLDETNYSESGYVTLAVNRFLDPIFTYNDWTFKLNWYIILKYLIYYKILYINNR